MNKKLLILLVLVILAIILGLILHFNKTIPTTTIPQGEKPSLTPVKKDLPVSDLPSGFSETLPAEGGSTILQNYEVTNTKGAKQSTRIFTTNKLLADAVKIYREYFLANEWIEVPTTPEPGTVTALFKKKNDMVSVTARTDSATKQKTVDITLTESNR